MQAFWHSHSGEYQFVWFVWFRFSPLQRHFSLHHHLHQHLFRSLLFSSFNYDSSPRIAPPRTIFVSMFRSGPRRHRHCRLARLWQLISGLSPSAHFNLVLGSAPGNGIASVAVTWPSHFDCGFVGCHREWERGEGGSKCFTSNEGNVLSLRRGVPILCPSPFVDSPRIVPCLHTSVESEHL